VVDQKKSTQGLDEMPVVPGDQPGGKPAAGAVALGSPPAAPKPADAKAPSLLDNLRASAASNSTSNDLKQIALAYHTYINKFKQPPSKLEDLQKVKLETDAAAVYKAVQDGKYVVQWNSSLTGMT